MAEKNKSNNRSLFLYTGLIFVVALLLILISFFGQTNLEKKQPKVDEETQRELTGITEKASVLSEENKNLLEENTALKKENEEQIEQIEQNNILLSAYGYLQSDAKDKALERLLAVNYDTLSADQQLIYNYIQNELGENLN